MECHSGKLGGWAFMVRPSPAGTVLATLSPVPAKLVAKILKGEFIYQTTIVREARRCWGAGWQAYDTMFHQHTATVTFTDWSKMNSLYAVTFLAQSNGRSRCCQYCLESDQGGQECALAHNHLSARSPPAVRWLGPNGRGLVGGGAQ